jgi:hypothetical protein
VFRSVASVFSALILAFLGVILVELMSSILHPFPPGFDRTSVESITDYVAHYPDGVLFVCAIGWWLTVLVSCSLATRLGAYRHPAHGMAVGLILLGLVVLNMAMLPYPLWFWINVIAVPVCMASGIWLARRKIQPQNVASHAIQH